MGLGLRTLNTEWVWGYVHCTENGSGVMYASMGLGLSIKTGSGTMCPSTEDMSDRSNAANTAYATIQKPAADSTAYMHWK